jgi:hypothetical protein
LVIKLAGDRFRDRDHFSGFEKSTAMKAVERKQDVTGNKKFRLGITPRSIGGE